MGERVAASADEAVAAAAELGFPVVVKTAAPGVHKTDIGGVALDLRDEEAGARRGRADRRARGRAAVPRRRGRAAGRSRPGSDVRPARRLRPGGALAELIGDAGFRLAPLTDLDAGELVTGGKAGRLVAGFRGAPPPTPRRSPISSSGSAGSPRICREVAELDLNPVLAGPDGCVAVDARVRVRARPPERRVKTW